MFSNTPGHDLVIKNPGTHEMEKGVFTDPSFFGLSHVSALPRMQ